MLTREVSFRELMGRLGMFQSVENAPSRNGQSTAPNQFILHYDNGTIFQSYDAVCGVKIGSSLFFTQYHDYSNITSRHVGAWCGYNARERRAGLDLGTFTKITNYYR